MSTLPLVSICVPTYNAAEFLENCLLSAIHQTYSNTEIFVCDDASTDNTVEIVNRLQQQYPQIRLSRNKNNLGMVNNWNHCIEEAKGEWIKLLFQDDLLEPTCVEEMLSSCERFQTLVAVCSRNFLLHTDIAPAIEKDFTQGNIKKAEAVLGHESFVSSHTLALAVKQHLTLNFIGEPTCYFFHRRLYREVGGFFPYLSQLVDYEFILRLGFVNGFAFLPEALVHFRVHKASQSSRNKKKDIVEAGDLILLQHRFLYSPYFAGLRTETGTALPETNMKHLYYSACKRLGKKQVNEGLKTIRTAFPEIGSLTYNFFKYVLYRRRMKKWNRVLQHKEESIR